jgi:hypothetical protein
MDKREELTIVAIIMVAAAFFCFIGYQIGFARAQEQTRQEAVDNHAAKWECDQKEGTRHIKWHSCPKHKSADNE